MRLDPDNKTGMWLCNALMVRNDITDEEKRRVTDIQRAIIAAEREKLEISEEEYFWLRRLWWRGKRDGKRKGIRARVELTRKLNSYGTDYIPSSIVLTCMDCGHKVGVFGRGEASKKRGGIMLRQECPYGENNFYGVADG
jgi:hypothetical protein